MNNIKNYNKKDKEHRILLLDGGTGEELFRRGVPDDRKIWSATAVVNSEFHSKLKEVHQSYFKAGSNAITTNSYGITPGVGFEEKDMLRYISIAARLAKESSEFQAKEKCENGINESRFVFGSVGPLVESYRPDLILPHAKGVSIYTKMMNSMQPHVSAYIAETMSSIEEAMQTTDAAVASIMPHMPLFVSFSLNSRGDIRSKENVLSGLIRFLNYVKDKKTDVRGILFNCSEPEAITIALKQIQENKYFNERLKLDKILLGAYANRLTPIEDNWSLQESGEAQAVRNDLNPQQYFEEFVKVWINDLGIQIVGGCCGVTPEHIAYIYKNIKVLKI